MNEASSSLILCAHNPRPDYFRRVIEACSGQKGLSASVEIIIVDSASDTPLKGWESNVPGCRTVRSDVPGLARARILGIRESTGETLVFVDDDTVLARNYLAQGLRILSGRPYLGAIGGQLVPEFEGPLSLDESYYRNYLAIREFQMAQWSNRWDDFATSPIGGGMIVRRKVAEAWANRAEASSWRVGLGRNGQQLSGGEDIDLLHMACEMDYGKGVFPELLLTHLMPAHRLSPDFLVRIFEGNSRSSSYLSAMLNPEFSPPVLRLRRRCYVFAQALVMKALDRRLYLAGERGRWEGWRQAVIDKA